MRQYILDISMKSGVIDMKKLKVVILAAGEGKRMRSKTPKVLHKLCGKTMIEQVIDVAKAAGADEICVVVGHGGNEVINSINDENIVFKYQTEQKGTGHAVMQAVDFIDDDYNIIVLYGDAPLIKAETMKELVGFHEKEANSISMISAILDKPEGYGHIVRDENGNFIKNIEHKDANEIEKAIKEINAGVYCFDGDVLKKSLSLLKNDNVQGEYYLPDTLEISLINGGRVNAMIVCDYEQFLGVNSKAQLSDAAAVLRRRINKSHMDNGVDIVDPERTYIDMNVRIGMDTTILPGVVIEGKTVIGEECKIGPDSRLTDMIIGNNVKLQYTTAVESSVGDGANVGPYAYIRPNSKIGKNVKIGDFVEIKNSTIGDDTKVSHLTYIGDTEAGERINFGCGTVTVNYDGKKKFTTVIEDDAFIGCNANLIAPVRVGKGSYVAAGSTITDDVPKDSFAIARKRQENKTGWVKK